MYEMQSILTDVRGVCRSVCHAAHLVFTVYYINSDVSGIPQGTVLGPILFIIYINDLAEVCKQFINVYLFADDAKLYKHVITDDDRQVGYSKRV